MEGARRELASQGDGLCGLLKGPYSKGVTLLELDAVGNAVQYARTVRCGRMRYFAHRAKISKSSAVFPGGVFEASGRLFEIDWLHRLRSCRRAIAVAGQWDWEGVFLWQWDRLEVIRTPIGQEWLVWRR